MEIDVEAIKKHGKIKELKAEIDHRIFDITNRTFKAFKDGNKFTRLRKCIDEAKSKIEEIETLLSALNKIQPGNK